MDRCVLSDSQIAQIREAALNYIERHGFVVQHEGLLARARARGAQVAETQGRVRMERAHDRVEQLVAGYESRVPHDIQEGLQRHFHDLYEGIS